jgi:hypothetical protein
MKSAIAIAVTLAGLGLMQSATPADAAVCARGVYRAGCAGPNGAVTTTARPPAAVTVHRPPTVTCAKGVYRAGCTGPNGAAVIRR